MIGFIKCKCGNEETNRMKFKDNGPHVEARCKQCASHIKFINRDTVEMMDIEIEPEHKSKALF